jgi:DNA topoisomerase IB
MEATITIPYEKFKELEKKQSTIAKLHEELRAERERKNGYLFLRTSMTSWNPHEGASVKIGTIDYSIEKATTFMLDEQALKDVVTNCIDNLLLNARYSYLILTKQQVYDAYESIDKRRNLMEERIKEMKEQEKKLDEKLSNLPKWLKWFL